MPHTDYFWRTFRPAEGFYTSEVREPRRLPVRTFLPTGYEPNYAYPLLVFFHGHGSNEEQLLRHAPQLSRRNYIYIALRGPQPLSDRADEAAGYSWEANDPERTLVEDYVLRAIEQTRRNYHVHSERIYLAGLAEGASLAYRLGLSFPERFAGVISLNGSLPRGGNPLVRLPEVRQLRVLIGHGTQNERVPVTTARSDFRLLYTAGLAVRMHTYPTDHHLHADMLRDVNRWIMELVNLDE